MKTWFELYNGGRYKRELDALSSAGVQFVVDPDAMAKGILRLHLHIDGSNPLFDLPDKKSINLSAVYPDNFPFFRPEVYTEDIQLPRHHDPIGKGLCLIPRSTEYWYPSATLASFLQEQLKKVLIQGVVVDEETLRADATEQAEPVSEFYPHHDAPVLFDPTAFDVSFEGLENVRLLGKLRVGVPDQASLPTRLAILKTIDRAGNTLSKLPNGIDQVFPDKMGGVVYQLPERPPFGNPKQDLEWLNNCLKKQGEKLYFPGSLRLSQRTEIKNVIGLCFPEEVAPGRHGAGWLFLLVGTFKELINNNLKKPVTVTKELYYYARASRINSTEVSVRIPQLRPLADKTVTVFGLGALGAPAAIEFARNGVKELRLLDFDIVDAATTVRWPFGLAAAGLYKTVALRSFIETNYPYTRVVIENRKIGGTRLAANGIPDAIAVSERDVVNKLIAGSSLIFNATVELGVMDFLASEAERYGLPFLNVYATEGALGGIIARVVPGRTEGCWMCLRSAIGDTIEEPPADPSGKIQAIGCGDISFTGAGFDLQNISLAGVRMAVSTLCEGAEDAYPALPFDVGVMSLVDPAGRPTLPGWKEYPLKKHLKCPYCGGA